MQVVTPSWEVVDNTMPLTKKIERVARICYKSEDRIGEGTDLKMVQSLISKQHMAMLEHGDLCFVVSEMLYNYLSNISQEMKNKHGYTSFLRLSYISKPIVSGNIRAWIETITAVAKNLHIYLDMFAEEVSTHLSGLDVFPEEVKSTSSASLIWGSCDLTWDISEVKDFSLLSMEERLVHETLSVIFVADRGVSHELVRMRLCSFAQESTRYCNYSNDKFGNEITVIKPVWYDSWSDSVKNEWLKAMQNCESSYLALITEGVPAQAARGVLPHNVKMEICCTATLQEWHHVLQLRACDTTGPAHPQMKEVMVPLCKWAKEVYKGIFDNCIIAA